MMTWLICVLIICCLTTGISKTEVLPEAEKSICKENLQGSSRFFEGQISGFVECLRQKMIEGIPIIGPHVHISLDPLKFYFLPLWLRNDYFKGFMRLRNFKLMGLAGFKLTKGNVSIGITKHSVKLGLNFEKILLTTKYKGNMNIFGLIDLYGSGTLSVELNNFDIDSDLTIVVPPRIQTLFLNITIPTTHAKITGLFHDEYMSDLISKQLSDTMTTLAAEEHNRINNILHSTLWPFIEVINNFLKSLTIQEIIEIIGSGINCEPIFDSVVDIIKKLIFDIIGIHLDSISLEDYNQHEGIVL